MIGSLIGGALKIGGAIFGGISAAKAAKKARKSLENAKSENQDWYDRRYNEDVTQRADAQRVLSLTAQRIKERNGQAAGTAAVMGGTEESVAAEKAANAQAMADAAAQIAVTGERRKDSVESQYRATQSDLNNRIAGLKSGNGQAIAQAAMGVGSAAMGLGESVDDYMEDRRAAKREE